MRTLLSFLISESVQEYKKMQCDMIKKYNPAEDDYHTWIRKPEDVMTWDEVYKEQMDEYPNDNPTPDYTSDMVQDINKTRKVTVYSSKEIKKGIFVTPSRMEAENYAGSKKVFAKTMSVDDIAWIDIIQGQYAPVAKKYLRSK